jgi:hypothetical protein
MAGAKSEVRVTPVSVHFDQMSWPLPRGEHGGLAWRMRYARSTVTESELLAAADIMNAYQALIFKSQKDRNRICKVLQDAINAQQTEGG